MRELMKFFRDAELKMYALPEPVHHAHRREREIAAAAADAKRLVERQDAAAEQAIDDAAERAATGDGHVDAKAAVAAAAAADGARVELAILTRAHRKATLEVSRAVLRNSDAIRASLTVALREVIGEVAALGPLLTAVDWSDEAAVLHAGPDVRHAFDVIETAATRYAAVRLAQRALSSDVDAEYGQFAGIANPSMPASIRAALAKIAINATAWRPWVPSPEEQRRRVGEDRAAARAAA